MKRLGIFVLVLIGFALMAMLYVIKTSTHTAYQEVKRLNKSLEGERAAITVLNAEIAHLESPARLRELSERYLELRPTQVKQVMTLDDMVVRIPQRPQAQPEAQAEGGQ